MSELASRIMRNFEPSFGYPPGDNVVVSADKSTAAETASALSRVGVRSDLIDFYSLIERVALPDGGSGIFVHSAEDVLDGVRGGQPTRITGFIHDEITVFGSDGGGGLFALSVSNGRVYRLDGGSLVGSTYDADEKGVRLVAASLSAFLEHVRDDVSSNVPSTWR